MTGEVIILAVCTANVCRSPAAEFILNSELSQVLSPSVVRAESVGIDALPGEPMCPQTRNRVGLAGAGHLARRLSPNDLQGADLVLALDRSHRSACARVEPACRSRLFTLRQAAMLADGLRVVLERGERPEGSPPIPEEPAARVRWLVAELDAARGGLGAGVESDLDIVDRHGPGPHADVVDEIDGAVRRIADAVGVLAAIYLG